MRLTANRNPATTVLQTDRPGLTFPSLVPISTLRVAGP